MEFVYEQDRIYSADAKGRLLAEVNFPSRDAQRVNLNHVFVDEELRGQGIASTLMELAYHYLKAEGKLIVAKCPYAIQWFKKHPEFQDMSVNVKSKK